jgi:hypothetical protein
MHDCFCFSTPAGHLRIGIYISRYQLSSESRIGSRPLLSLWGMKWLWMTSKCKSSVYVAAVLTACWSVFLFQSFRVSSFTVRCCIHRSLPTPKSLVLAMSLCGLAFQAAHCAAATVNVRLQWVKHHGPRVFSVVVGVYWRWKLRRMAIKIQQGTAH